MLNLLPKIMLICLVITIVVECLLTYILKIKKKEDVLIVLFVNILTNPLLVSITFSIGVFYGITYKNIVTLVLELLAFFIEGFIYQKVLINKKINPYLLSLILNLSS